MEESGEAPVPPSWPEICFSGNELLLNACGKGVCDRWTCPRARSSSRVYLNDVGVRLGDARGDGADAHLVFRLKQDRSSEWSIGLCAVRDLSVGSGQVQQHKSVGSNERGDAHLSDELDRDATVGVNGVQVVDQLRQVLHV